MNKEKSYRISIVALSLLVLVLSLLLNRQIGVNESEVLEGFKGRVETAEARNRELADKVFELETEIGRYQVTLEHLRSVDPRAANYFEDFMYTKTE